MKGSAIEAEAGRTRAATEAVGRALFLVAWAFVCSRTARDALFFRERGLFDLPLAYIGIAVASPPTAFLTLQLLRRLGARRTRVVAPRLVAAVLALQALVATPGGGFVNTAFFVYVPVAFGVLFSLTWLLAADLFEGAPLSTLTRVYSRLGAAAIAGGAFAGLLAHAASGILGPRRLLLLAAAGLVLTSFDVARTQHRHPLQRPADTAPRPQPHLGSFAEVVRRPYTSLLLAVAVLTALVGVLVEFQFYLAASSATRTIESGTRLFADLYLILNATALLLQLGVMPALQRRLGLHGSLLVLPAALLGGSALLLGWASLFARSAMRAAEGGLKSGIHRTNWEQTYLPIRRELRPAAKLVVDGMGPRLAEGLAGGVLLLWTRRLAAGGGAPAQGAQQITLLLLATVAVWLGLTTALGRRLIPWAREEAVPWRPEIPLPDT